MQIGVNSAVKIKKNTEIPSTAKRAGLKMGSIPGTHSILFISWNKPSPSKVAHKSIVAVKVNKDPCSAIFHKRLIFSLGVINIKKILIKFNKNTSPSIIIYL